MFYIELRSSVYNIVEDLFVEAETTNQLEGKLLEYLNIKDGNLLLLDSLSNFPYDAQITDYTGNYPNHYYLNIKKVKVL